LNASFWNHRGLLGVLLIAAAGMLGLAGCAQDPPILDDATAQALAALRYPGLSEYGPDLDIIVTREGDAIRLTNRTARRYEGMQLWLNQQYVRQVDQINIGANPDMHLKTFINRHREPFPTGTFLQPDLARSVISAELYDPAGNVRYRLTVQPDNEVLRL
jgi:hypothetical protein